MWQMLRCRLNCSCGGLDRGTWMLLRWLDRWSWCCPYGGLDRWDLSCSDGGWDRWSSMMVARMALQTLISGLGGESNHCGVQTRLGNVFFIESGTHKLYTMSYVICWSDKIQKVTIVYSSMKKVAIQKYISLENKLHFKRYRNNPYSIVIHFVSVTAMWLDRGTSWYWNL